VPSATTISSSIALKLPKCLHFSHEAYLVSIISKLSVCCSTQFPGFFHLSLEQRTYHFGVLTDLLLDGCPKLFRFLNFLEFFLGNLDTTQFLIVPIDGLLP